MSKLITVAIAGAGGRGRNAYANIILRRHGLMKVVAVADLIREKVDITAKEHGIPENMCFNSAEEMLEQPKLADMMFICTQDKDHYGHAMKALEKGYHLLLEKPISPSLTECKQIAELANQKGLKVIVCHVLRYTPYYKTLKEKVKKGEITQAIADADTTKEALISYIGMDGVELVDGNDEPFILQDGDVILLCSDGLFKSLSEAAISRIVRTFSDNIPMAAKILTYAAVDNRPRGQDNTTVILVKYNNKK